MEGDFRLYTAPGLNFNFYYETDVLGGSSKSALGINLKVGGVYLIGDSLALDFFAGYSYCKMKPGEVKFDIGGINGGLGIRYILK